MNPTKLVTEAVTHEFPALAVIASSDWFSAFKKEPGQPGVYEVNGVSVCDGEEPTRRFSYFNGRQFCVVRSTPEAAFAARFDKPTLVDSKITAFRGLVEEA